MTSVQVLDSLFDPATLWARAQAVRRLALGQRVARPGLRRYLADGVRLERLDWYPAELAERSDDDVPPAVPPIEDDRLIAGTLAGLGLPAHVLDGPDATWHVGGGYAVASGHGDIDHRDSPLHERRNGNVAGLRPGWIRVDAATHTTAPMLAARAARLAVHLLDRTLLELSA